MHENDGKMFHYLLQHNCSLVCHLIMSSKICESGKGKKRSNNDYSFLILMGHCSIMFLHTKRHLCTFYGVHIFFTLCNFGTLRFKLLMRNLLCKVAWKGVINAHTFNCKRLIAFQDHYLLSFLHSNLTLQKTF